MRSKFKRVRGALAVVAVIGAAIVGSLFVTNPGSSSSTGTGNVWLDNNGGSCLRSASLVPYNDATACGTVNAAYLAAQPGDTVRMADNQTITLGSILPDPSKAGNTTDVVFQSGVNTLVDACPSGSCGTVYPFTIDAHDITFNNFKFANQTSNLRDDYEEPATGAGSSNITFVNLDSSSIQVFGANTTVTGGDIGPCFTNKANPVCTPRAFGSTNATFDGVTFHDQMSDQTTGGPCASAGNPTDTCHTDGLGVFAGATNTTVKNSRFYNNDNTNIRVQNNGGGTNSGVTIQNNFFGVTWQTSALPSSDDTTTTTVTNPWLFGVDIDTPTAGLVISHNSFYFRPSCPTGTGCGNGLSILSTAGTSASPAVIRGNITTVQGGVCNLGNAAWTYNIIRAFSDVNGPTAPTGNCNSTNVFQAYNTTWPYVTAPPFSNFGTGPGDFHINGAAWAGDDMVTVGCPSTDIDGETRTSTCDAGADERSLTPGASLATCSPSPCTQGSPVSHTVNAADSTTGGSGSPSAPLTRAYDYISERPNNLTGNAPLVVVNVADMTGSTFDEISAANKFQVLMLPPWNAGQVATPTVQARLTPVPQPATCGVGGNNVCDNIPAIKAAIDAVIAAGGVDTSRIYITGPSKGGLEATDAVCDTRTYSYFTAMANVSWYSMVQNTNTTPASAPSQTTPGFCPSMLGTDRTAGDGIGGTKLTPPFNNMSMLFGYGTFDTVACTSTNNAPAGTCMDLGWIDNQNRWVFSGPQMAGEASPPSSNGATGRSVGGSSVMFGAVMGCSGTPSQTITDTAQGGNVTEKIYTGCAHSNRATATIRVNGGGHSYSGLDSIDGYSSEQAIWNFFVAYGGP